MLVLDHVALVTPSLEPVLERLAALGLPTGPIEAFEGEGTREVYLGAEAAKLLLVQPTSPESPYGRALSKRGPGLHHVALNAPDLSAFLDGVRGWLLLPASLKTIERSRTAWLARPGVATLLEVHEAGPTKGAPLVTAIELPGDLDLVPDATLRPSGDGRVWLTLAGQRFGAAELAAG